MKPSKQTLLWEINGAGLPGASYVFGTMHVRDQRVFRRLQRVYAAIDACEAFAAEFDLNGADAIGSLETFSLPDGVTLDRLMSAKKYKKLQQALRKMTGIELNFLKNSQPILISNLIEEQIMASDMPFSLDQHLWQYAEQNGKQMLGIETLQEQIEILQQISLEQQIKSLLGTIRNMGHFRRNLLKMANWYEQGNIQQPYQASRRGAHGLRKLLLYNRNALMAERIGQMVSEQPVFCAIGAAHLGGMKGVLRYLKQAGFKINAIPLVNKNEYLGD